MSDTNRVNVAFLEEVTFGVTPSGNPAIDDLRFVSESFGSDTAVTESQEIRSDRQIPDVIRTSLSASGALTFEFSYGAYDPFLEAGLLSSDFTTEVVVNAADTDVSAANADNSFNRVASWDNTPTAGEWIDVAGFLTNAVNNGLFRVESATANKIVVSGGLLITEAAGDSVTIDQGASITNGTELRFFSLEKEFLDLTNEFEVLRGMCVDTISLSVGSDTIVTGELGFIGKDSAGAAATFGDGTNTASPANPVFNGIDNIIAILEDQAAFATTAFTLELSNNLRARLQIGTLGAISIGTGRMNLSGTLQAYFNDNTTMDKYRGFTTTQMAIKFTDGTRRYIIDMPEVKLVAGRTVAGGIDQDVIQDFSFTAFRDASLGHTIKIVRFP